MSSTFLKERIALLDLLYAELDRSFAAFRKVANFGCKVGCGACCAKPNAVWAMVGEMLPMALGIYKEGRLEDVCGQLADQEVTPTLCSVYKAAAGNVGMGRCTSYNERPVVCRLFGSSARRVNNDVIEMMACAWQRVQFADTIRSVEELSGTLLSDVVPIANDWSWRVKALMQEDSLREEYPINQALYHALLLVEQATAYEMPESSFFPRIEAAIPFGL